MKQDPFLSALLCGAVVTLSAGACKSKGKEAPAPGSAAVSEPGETPEAPAADHDAAVEEAAPVATGDFVAASNALGMDLYRVAGEKPGNVLFSAPSIAVAFAMTYAGASGTTAEEMRQVLHIAEGNDIHESASAVLSAWNQPEEDYELRVVNRLFGEASYSFEAPFLERVATSYSAPLESLDFKGQPEAQRKHINGWVMEQTEQRIDELLPEDSIRPDTRLVLVNAIYFLGTWAKTFDAKATSQKPFFVNGSKQVKVPTMAQTSYFHYAEGKGFKILEMPYKGSDLAMTIILPDDAKGLKSIEAQMSAETLPAWLAELHQENISVQLPRFELANARLALVDALKTLGMTSAFDRSADFSAMAKPASSDDDLYISSAFHEAFIKVDERGTEAAAATAVVMATKGAMPAKPIDFHVDHPFLFAIRDTKSGALLFLGRVVDPR